MKKTFHLPRLGTVEADVVEHNDHMDIYVPNFKPDSKVKFKFDVMRVFTELASAKKADYEARICLQSMNFLQRVRSIRLIDPAHVKGSSCHNVAYSGYFF